MFFSVTERGSFRRCRRKAVLTSKNGQHLGPMFSPLSLNVGTIVHRAHQLWLERPDTSLIAHAMQASVEAQAQVRENYYRQVGTYPSDGEMLITHESVDMALTMCENYEIKYGTPLPPEYKLLAAEQKVRVPVLGTEHKCVECRGTGTYIVEGLELHTCPACDGSGTARHMLEGKLDGLIQHTSGRIDVLEHKTYGARPNRTVMQMNDQFIAYLWLVQQLGFNAHLDSCIAYDGLWRRDKVPRGRTFDDLFARYTLTRTPDELKEFARFLPLELNDMAHLYAHPETAYINRQWLGCNDCGVIDLCVAMSRKEDTTALLTTKYTKRTDDLDTDDESDTNDAS